MDQESLRGLLNIDRADRVFQDLLRHVADQGKEIAELRAMIGRCATAEVVRSSIFVFIVSQAKLSTLSSIFSWSPLYLDTKNAFALRDLIDATLVDRF